MAGGVEDLWDCRPATVPRGRLTAAWNYSSQVASRTARLLGPPLSGPRREGPAPGGAALPLDAVPLVYPEACPARPPAGSPSRG